jgi:NAD-dependent deacetylase
LATRNRRTRKPVAILYIDLKHRSSRKKLLNSRQTIDQAIGDARRLLVITGAGISAESGISTFRDANGWWKTYKPEELATRKAFDRDPSEVWRWYDMRRAIVAGAEPNPAHRALARVEASGRRVVIVTQNVDDLHERAGSREIIHVHGSIWQLKCTAEETVFEDRRVPLPVIPPICPCGHIARPNIVWWDEDLDPAVIARVDALFDEPFDLVLVIGTQATFDYIRNWALRGRAQGALLVEINLRTTPLTPYVDVRLEGKAGEVLDAILSNQSNRLG